MGVPFPGQAVRAWPLNRKWGAVRLPKLGDVDFRWSRAPAASARAVRRGTGGRVPRRPPVSRPL